jgi:hypothetical protein
MARDHPNSWCNESDESLMVLDSRNTSVGRECISDVSKETKPLSHFQGFGGTEEKSRDSDSQPSESLNFSTLLTFRL